jgi:LemA protein
MDNTNQSFFARYKTGIIVVLILVVVAIWAVSSYNFFVRSGESITAQWSQVENQYQRRFDLIPNIVSTVKGYASHEQAIIAEITEARTRYAGATTADAKAQAASQLEAGLGRLLVIAEQYPALQSAPLFKDLMTTLEGTENRISVERMKYNDLVRVFDTKIKTFPSSIVAAVFGVEERAYFDVPAENQVNPQVQF